MKYRPRTMLLFTALLLSVIIAACGGTPVEQTNNPLQSAPTAQTTPSSTGSSSSSAGDTYTIVAPPTEAIYQAQEQFLDQNLPSTATGKTNSVEGAFQLLTSGEKPVITDMNIKVDLRTLKSDQERRDNALKERWLESNTYPYAVFVAKEIQTIPAGSGEGDTVEFAITGDMTIHDVTHEETFQVKGQLQGDTITGTAITKILLVNYNVEPPNISGFLTVEDGITLTVNFTAKKG